MSKTRLYGSLTAIIPWLCCIFVAALAYVFLIINNSDTLYTAQSLSIFQSGGQFFRDCMAAPGGLIAWAGCWFTQLFYTPWQGAAMLTAVWLLTFYIIKRAYGIRDAWSPAILIPILCLLISVICLGYWIYYGKHVGYFFRESLGVLAMAVLVWGQRSTSGCFERKGKTTRRLGDIAASLTIALTFPLIGCYALLALASIAMRHLAGRNWGGLGIAALAFVATPLLFTLVYDSILPGDMFVAGFPKFESGDIVCAPVSTLFGLIAAWFLICPLAKSLPRPKNGKVEAGLQAAAAVAIAALGCHAVAEADYNDENYHAEMRMYRSLEEFDWEKTLGIAAEQKGDATRQIVIMKNIALFNTGRIGNELYHYNNMGEKPHTRDSLRVSLVHVAGSMIHLHHGKTNFAYRWAMENAVEYGFNVNNLKIMSLCAMVNGERELAIRYLDRLSRTMNHKEWADHYRPIVEGKAQAEDFPELKNICELRRNMGSRLDSDQGICEIYLIKYFSDTMSNSSKYFQEMTLAYALMSKDIQKFWPHFFLYANMHPGETMPIHYQEAAYLYGILEPQTMDTSGMPFDEERIKRRYADFDAVTKQLLGMGMSAEEVGRQTRPRFGDTFWWNYFFVRDINSY